MATITTSDELRLFNRSRILSCLRSGGRQSRKFLCESTGLSASTVSQVTADLIDDGVIELFTPKEVIVAKGAKACLLYTSPSPRDGLLSRMPSSA